jgi:hypothetical protein
VLIEYQHDFTSESGVLHSAVTVVGYQRARPGRWGQRRRSARGGDGRPASASLVRGLDALDDLGGQGARSAQLHALRALDGQCGLVRSPSLD